MFAVRLEEKDIVQNRCLRRWALSLGLKPSETVYKSWGKGQKADLRFSKSGDPSIERAYSTHYVDVELLRQRRGRSTGGSAVVSPSRRNIYASAKPKGR